MLKIKVSEIDFECDSDVEDDTDEEDKTEEQNQHFHEKRNDNLDMCSLRAAIQANLICNACHQKVTFSLKRNHHQGLGTNLILECNGESCTRNKNGFFSTSKLYESSK